MTHRKGRRPLNIYIRPLAHWAESQGWTVLVEPQGATVFYDQEGTYIARYPSDPSNPHRRLTDVLAAMKRAGLPLPGPGEWRPARRTG